MNDRDAERFLKDLQVLTSRIRGHNFTRQCGDDILRELRVLHMQVELGIRAREKAAADA
jgi:hypothetical protein